MRNTDRKDYTPRELAQLVRRKMIQRDHGSGNIYKRDKQSWKKDFQAILSRIDIFYIFKLLRLKVMEELDERFMELWHRANDASLGAEICFYALQIMRDQKLTSPLLAMQIALEDWDC